MQSTGTGWIYVDLGAPYNISEVRLNWETAYAVNYQIQVCNDAVNWVAIKTVTGNQSKGSSTSPASPAIGTIRPDLLHPDQRRLRQLSPSTTFRSTARRSPTWPRVGPPSPRRSRAPTTRPAMAVDGNSSTRWSSGQWMQTTGTGWIYVDLGAPYNISEVRLNWETAYAVNYQIQVSDDAVNWIAIKTVTGNQSRASSTSPASPATGDTSASTAPRPAPAPITTPSTTSRSTARRLPFVPAAGRDADRELAIRSDAVDSGGRDRTLRRLPRRRLRPRPATLADESGQVLQRTPGSPGDGLVTHRAHPGRPVRPHSIKRPSTRPTS